MGNIVKTILPFGKFSKGILVATVPKASKISKQQWIINVLSLVLKVSLFVFSLLVKWTNFQIE
jgi:hypothetical protein